MRVNRFGHFLDLFIRRVETAEANVVANRTGEYKRILQYDSNLGTKTLDRDIPNVLTINLNSSFCRIIEAT
ncbi:hypothetical protein D3C85_1766850 [compost metagenome]